MEDFKYHQFSFIETQFAHSVFTMKFISKKFSTQPLQAYDLYYVVTAQQSIKYEYAAFYNLANK